jgi:uncharacterized protein YjbJ (UPF0337 family)
MATQLQLQGRWNEIKGKVKEKWGAITDQDLMQAEGNIDRLVGVIQRKSGESRETIERYLEDALGKGESMVEQVTGTAREYAQAARQQVGETYEQVADTVRQGYEQAEEYVQRNPTQSVAIAFGCGVLTGLVVGLLMRSR